MRSPLASLCSTIGWLALAAAGLASPGCARSEAEQPPPAGDVGTPPDDPLAPCRQALDGTWTAYDLTARFDGGSGALTLAWRGQLKVAVTLMKRCALPDIELTAEGWTLSVHVDGADTLTARVAGQPPLVLHRQP